MNRILAFLKKAYSYDIVRYTSVGGINTIVIFGLFFLFNDLIGVGILWANCVAYVGGVVSNFTMNKLFTFRSHKFRVLELLLFGVSWAVSYGVQLAVFRGLMDGLGWSENIAAFLAYPLYGLAFYLQCKYVAFNPRVTGRTPATAADLAESEADSA